MTMINYSSPGTSAILIYFRMRGYLHAKRTAWMSIAGFMLSVVILLGMFHGGDGFHRFFK